MVALTRIQEKERDWPRIAGHPVHPEVEAMVLFLAEQLKEKKTRVLQLETEVYRLKGALATHTKHRFGPRSERYSSKTDQQTQDKKRKKGAQLGHKGSGRKQDANRNGRATCAWTNGSLRIPSFINSYSSKRRPI